ncbi:MAG: hypothetical protein V2I33_26165 [Kangiellaceae bacterium]|jgi:hypothetical protein|nr:hypothetical protein [Kangiellaceae bacterium]
MEANRTGFLKKVGFAFLAVLGVVGIVALVALYNGPATLHANVDATHDEFKTWMVKHGKDHTDDEYHYRLSVYLENKAIVEEHNSGNHSY